MNIRNKIIHGDNYTLLKEFPAECIDTVVTSPPYYALRDYELPPTKWPECQLSIMYGFPPITIPAMECCLGLEPDPLQYIAHLVLVFEEIKRVLKPHGTVWLNIGDTYVTNTQSGNKVFGNPEFARPCREKTKTPKKKVPKGMKVKDMMGIPWMLAFALRTAGWYLRSDVIWYKDNAMPESVKDRPSKAHEYVFLLTKNKNYYYDHDAIREPHLPQSVARAQRAKSHTHKNANGAPGQPVQNLNRPRPNINDRRTPQEALDLGQALHAVGSNKRTVWTVSTVAFPEAHFATFPEKLITPCIKASTSRHGNCAECGKPYTRDAEYRMIPTDKAAVNPVVDARDHAADENDQGSNRQKDGHKNGYITEVITKGWKKPCKCKTNEIVKPIVYDPYMGAATTALVSSSHGCDYVGHELGGHYLPMQNRRLRDKLGVFAPINE